MANRTVQQLEYDGTRLFCPVHPTRELEEAITEGEHGTFSMVCTAPVAGAAGCTCMRSAEWHSHEEMMEDLGQGN